MVKKYHTRKRKLFTTKRRKKQKKRTRQTLRGGNVGLNVGSNLFDHIDLGGTLIPPFLNNLKHNINLALGGKSLFKHLDSNILYLPTK